MPSCITTKNKNVPLQSMENIKGLKLVKQLVATSEMKTPQLERQQERKDMQTHSLACRLTVSIEIKIIAEINLISQNGKV